MLHELSVGASRLNREYQREVQIWSFRDKMKMRMVNTSFWILYLNVFWNKHFTESEFMVRNQRLGDIELNWYGFWVMHETTDFETVLMKYILIPKDYEGARIKIGIWWMNIRNNLIYNDSWDINNLYVVQLTTLMHFAFKLFIHEFF